MVAARAVVLALLVAPMAASAADTTWPLRMTGLAQAQGLDGTGVVVAVLDSGFDHTHPALRGKDWSDGADPPNGIDDDLDGWTDDDNGWDFCHGAPPRDRPGYTHGTYTAGALAGRDPANGMHGVAPGVRLMDVQVFCDDDSYPAMDGLRGRDPLREGLRYAIQHGADIIQMSLQRWQDKGEGTLPGLRPGPLAYADEFQAAADAGILVIGAAGNLGVQGPDEPGRRPTVLSVGADTGCDVRHGFSNWGAGVDLWAPGRVYMPRLGGGYEWAAGTSFATPLVVGAAALLLQQDPSRTPQDVQRILLENARAGREGPALDLHAVFGAVPEPGDGRLHAVGPSVVGGRHHVQFSASGGAPVLVEVVAGPDHWCFDVANQADSFYVAPAPGAPVALAVRPRGATWAGDWTNLTYTFREGALAEGERPLLAAAPLAAAGQESPVGLPIVALALAALLSRRRTRS